MKFVYIGDSLREPATLEISDDITNILNYLLNMERRDLQKPNIIAYRVWGKRYVYQNTTIYYVIWMEFTKGTVQNQQYYKYEFLVRRVK